MDILQVQNNGITKQTFILTFSEAKNSFTNFGTKIYFSRPPEQKKLILTNKNNCQFFCFQLRRAVVLHSTLARQTSFSAGYSGKPKSGLIGDQISVISSCLESGQQNPRC